MSDHLTLMDRVLTLLELAYRADTDADTSRALKRLALREMGIEDAEYNKAREEAREEIFLDLAATAITRSQIAALENRWLK